MYLLQKKFYINSSFSMCNSYIIAYIIYPTITDLLYIIIKCNIYIILILYINKKYNYLRFIYILCPNYPGVGFGCTGFISRFLSPIITSYINRVFCKTCIHRSHPNFLFKALCDFTAPENFPARTTFTAVEVSLPFGLSLKTYKCNPVMMFVRR